MKPLLLAALLALALPLPAQDTDQDAPAESSADYTRTVAEKTRVLADDPHNVMAFCDRGYAYSELGKYAEAAADYNSAVQLAPDFVLAYVNRGINNGLAGHPDQELEDEAHALSLDPRNSAARSARGLAYFRQGKFDRAIDDFDVAIDPEANAGSPDEESPPSGFRDSAGNFQGIVGVDTLDEHLYYYRGMAYLKLGRPDRALADLNKSVLVEPAYFPAYAGRAECFQKQGDTPRAIAEYDRLVELAPKAGLIARGNYYGDHGDPARALADFQRLLSLDPLSALAYNARAWMLATGPAGRDGHAAIADAMKACELSHWRDTNSIDTLAAAYAETGDFEQALKWQTKAAALLNPGQSVEDITEIKDHLALYQQHKPLHREK